MGRKRKTDNQNNSAAKVVKQDEVENQEPIVDQQQEQNEPALKMNPLLMTEILPIVFNYLDIDSLKKSRLVCTLWRFEGGKILLKKTNLLVERFERNPKNVELENFLKTAGTTIFNLSTEKVKDTNNLKNALPLLLEQTQALTVGYQSDYSQLDQLLQLFPNLKVLHFGNKWGILNKVVSDEAKDSILEKLESLEEIKLKLNSNWQVGHLTELLLNKDKLVIKEIHVPVGTFMDEYLQSGCDWPIDTLVLEPHHFYTITPEFLITLRAFLEKISGSLKHLTLVIIGLDLESLPDEDVTPWTKNCIIPLSLTQLETLTIVEEYVGSADQNFVWLLFTCALQLPNLKSLAMDQVPENLDDRIRAWNNHPDASGRALISKSLEELKIIQTHGDKILAESLIIFSCRLWPNLKSLYLANPPNCLPSLFSLSEMNWIGLEQLDLKFDKMTQENANLWTSWLAGSQNSDESSFTLQNLKNLKHVGFAEFRSARSTPTATEFLAENCLKFMTQLQSLNLQYSKMSKEVKKMLKETLGPTVNIGSSMSILKRGL